MNSNFDQALALVLKSEGGYVNHPSDPGGETNLGVTKRVWEGYVGRACTPGEMKTLTPAMVAPLYRKNYWDVMACDQLPGGVDYAAFDFAVNAGPGQAKKTLQRALGVNPDGAIGPKTIEAIKAANGAHLLREFSAEKEKFYRGLSTFATFGKGWMNRIAHVEDSAKSMVA
jgi:lysozyme family protein